jgi:sulfate/thiosulfate transport system permease protein
MMAVSSTGSIWSGSDTVTTHAIPIAAKRSRKPGNALPGFGPAMGFTLFYLSVIVLIPLSTLVLTASRMSGAEFTAAVFSPRALAAYRLSFTASLIAASINAVFGLIVAWVLVRYRFPGRQLLDALVDLPFALPTAVSGIVLTTMFKPTGILGQVFEPLGIPIAYSRIGITIALVLIGLPFVVRSVQPALEDLDPESEEAAACLGAGRWTLFRRVILPPIVPAVLTGFALAFARAIGEYGSVIFIAGNMPMKTEIVPLLIVIKLEQYDVAGATAIATVMLAASFLMLLVINLLQGRSRKYQRST